MAVVGARELLGLAVMHDPASDAAAAALQQEATAHLAALCKRHPALIATVLAEAVAQVPLLATSAAAAARLLAALAPLPMGRWVITSQQLDALAHLMSEGHLGYGSTTASASSGCTSPLLSPATKPAPPAATAGGDNERGETTSRDLASALSPPLPRAPADSGAAAEAAVRRRLGCAVWEGIRWEHASPPVRERGLLLLLSLRAHMPRRWWWGALLGATAAPLLATPLADETLEHLLRAQAAPSMATDPLPGGLTAVQCLLLLALEARQRGGGGGGGGGGSSGEVSEVVSLVELGRRYFLWQRVGTLIASGEPNATRLVLSRLLQALAHNLPHELPREMSELLCEYMRHSPAHQQAMRAEMLNTLAEPSGATQQAWLAVWAGLLAPACATDDNAAALLDTLVHVAFASAEQTLAESPLLPALQAARHTRAQVLAFVSAKRYWLGLAAAQAFVPRLPGEASLPGHHPGTELLATSSTQPLTALAVSATSINTAAPSALLADAGAVAMRVAAQARQQLPAARSYGTLSEDKKQGLLSSADGAAASSSSALALSADAAWGIGGAAAAGSQQEGTGYAEMGGGGGSGAPSAWARLSGDGGDAMAGCGLGLMMEIAISLGSDVRALLFWEQFFVLYFAAAEAEPTLGFLPPARRASLNAHFSRIAKEFERKERRVYMLYECFTTWSDEIIPRRGAFLSPGSINAEGKEHFISLLTALYPAPVVRLHAPAPPAAADTTDGDADATYSALSVESIDLQPLSLQPLQLGMAVAGVAGAEGAEEAMPMPPPPPLPAPLRALIDRSGSGEEATLSEQAATNLEVLRGIMPRRRPPPTARELACRTHLGTTGSDDDDDEGTRLALLQAHIVRRVRQQTAAGGSGALLEMTSEARSPQPEMHEPLPGWEADLTSASLEFRSCLLGVHVLDAEYLLLVQQLNINQRSAESKRVMVRHPECEQPVLFIVPQVKVVPGPPAVRERLQANRAEFVVRHSTLRDLAARFARLAALLDAAVSSMHLGVSSTHLELAGAEGSSSKLAVGSKLPEHEHEHALRAGGTELFFCLLPVALGYGLPPPAVAPLAAHLTSLLRSLGDRCVARQAEVQKRLLLAVLQARAAPPPEGDLDLRDLSHLDLQHLGGGGARDSPAAGGGTSSRVEAEEAGRVAAIKAVERAEAAEAAAVEAAAASAAVGVGGGTLVRLPERGGGDNQVTSGTRLQAAAPTVDSSGNLNVPLLAPSGEEEARPGEYVPPGGAAAGAAAGAAGAVGAAEGGERVAVRLPSPVSAGQMCSNP